MLINLNSSQPKTANNWIFHTPPLQYIKAISGGGHRLTSESPLYNITCAYKEGVDFLSYLGVDDYLSHEVGGPMSCYHFLVIFITQTEAFNSLFTKQNLFYIIYDNEK